MILTFSPNGLTAIGTRMVAAYIAETDYSITAPVTGVVATTMSGQADAGLATGVCLFDPSTVLVTGDIGDHPTDASGGVNDRNLSSLGTSTGGLIATLQVFTLTGTGAPTVTVKIQHSDDSATWVDLITAAQFTPTSLTAPGSAIGFVTFGTVINRYLRAVVTTAGSTISATVLVAAARQ